ncbi:DUF5105 domain-containing protein [Listeria costaricensis]|uniref:DUF5105 domain-containing protein n=1 Tax=Listeria costaricensis TaxID=2026604 RepID=UPI0013C46012|nr:DUF5105 domain-containing protein [Listeria costaricensis]
MKRVIGSLAVLSLMMLAGCGGTSDQEKEKETGKTETAETSNFAKVKVEDGSYAIAPEIAEDDLSTLALTIKVTNTGKGKLDVMPENFELYEDGSDEKVKPEDVYAGDEIDTFDYETISADKTETGTVFFNVDPKKEYKLVYEAYNDEGDTKEVELALDLTQYEDSKKAFDESEKAGNAFLDVQLLGKENENYDKLVGNDKEQTKAELLDEYQKENEDYLFYDLDLSDEDYENCFNSFISTQGKRAKLDIELAAQYEDQAALSIEIDEALSEDSISDLYSQYENDYTESTDDYDYEAGEEYAFSKYAEILEKSDLKSESSELYLYLEKKDGKWTVDLKNDNNERTISALLGSMY